MISGWDVVAQCTHSSTGACGDCIDAAMRSVADSAMEIVEAGNYGLDTADRLHLAERIAAFARRIAEQERELCIDDIQDAVGDWGGPEREHYTQAMQRSIYVIKNRAKGLDQWGRPLSNGPAAKE